MFPDSWMDVAVVVLRDDANDISVHTVSQAVPVPLALVEKARSATPSDFPYKSSGFSVTIGELMHMDDPRLSTSDWHASTCGLSRQAQLHVACLVVLGIYTLISLVSILQSRHPFCVL